MNDLDFNTRVIADTVLALIEAHKKTPDILLPDTTLFDAVCNLFETAISNDEPAHYKIFIKFDG